MKETVSTLGLILFFAGAMMAIAGSSSVTEGGISASKYFQIGIIELVATVILLLGLYLIIRSR